MVDSVPDTGLEGISSENLPNFKRHLDILEKSALGWQKGQV